ncbi:MAG: hypothetical protein HKP40_13410 [Litoreibacter sp.]|nr:hypothetical protein [Litoreibacter sp.]
MDGPSAERTQARRADFLTLIEATLPHAIAYGMPAEQALNWQVAAKAAQANLLHHAKFSADERRADRARQASDASLHACDGLLLGA